VTTNASQTQDHESGRGKDHGKDHGDDHGSSDGSSDGSATDHDHSTGHGHGHGVAADADRRWLSIALALISAFLVGEVVVGIVAHSLALLSDAAHMLTDAASIVLALIAMRLSARPARGIFTYGLRRTEILSAQANGLTLLLLSVWLTYEAVRRLIDPGPVAGGLVLTTAGVGIVVNVAAAWAISKANRSSLNIEGAFQHILTDLYGFVATALAGLVVLLTGFARADAIASLVVVVLMLRAGTGLVRDAGRIFLEAAPSGVDPDSLGDRLVALQNVNEVHDLHVWQITSGQTALSAHVLVEVGTDCHGLRRDLEQLLADDYSITHTTLQVDHTGPSADPTPADAQLLPLAEQHCADTHGPVHREGPHAH
jgi:cobalt-zinc-cadmium efflux system protein